jgi:hypothetical protein
MPDTQAKKTPDEAKAELKALLADLDLEEVKEFDEKDFWGFWVNFGSYPVLIENQKGMAFCVVAFQISLPPGEPVTKLNELYAKNDFKFIFELFSAFSSPVTGFSRIFENEKVVGFTVSKYIYPFHAGFSIRDLDEALQAVISSGALGVMFLKSLLGEWEEEEKTAKELGKSEPGPMYE